MRLETHKKVKGTIDALKRKRASGGGGAIRGAGRNTKYRLAGTLTNVGLEAGALLPVEELGHPPGFGFHDRLQGQRDGVPQRGLHRHLAPEKRASAKMGGL
jgi:hypothetical protein